MDGLEVSKGMRKQCPPSSFTDVIDGRDEVLFDELKVAVVAPLFRQLRSVVAVAKNAYAGGYDGSGDEG